MLKRMIIGLVASLILLILAFAATSTWLSRPQFDESLAPQKLRSFSIAPASEALTLARYRDNEVLKLLLVTRWQEDQLTGVDLNRALGTTQADPLRLFAGFGYAGLGRAAEKNSSSITIPASALALPFETHDRNIGIGTNYRAHAREVQMQEQPFVFPKLARPTPFNATVPSATRLDYEAELGLVALVDIGPDRHPETLGLVLANDFTDRWALVKNFSGDAKMGITGFADGKGGMGHAPIGPLLVIPRDLESFYPKIELSLYVNNQLRQRQTAAAMIWQPAAILEQIFLRSDWRFQRSKDSVSLLTASGKLTAGTIIFSGTPAGVVFKPVNLWNPWLYLQDGDEVVMHSDYLGFLHNRIAD